jgi:hypothetical protein
MRRRVFLWVGCGLCAAAVASGCRISDESTKSTPPGQKGGWAVNAREVPLTGARQESLTAASEPTGLCEPGDPPVTIVVVKSAKKVRSAAALWEATPVVARDSETVVFADGRIVTSRIEATGEHLKSLGWSHRDIEIVGSPAAATAAWQRRRG